MRWLVKVWDGWSTREVIREGSYGQVVASCTGYPPSHIWSIEPA